MDSNFIKEYWLKATFLSRFQRKNQHSTYVNCWFWLTFGLLRKVRDWRSLALPRASLHLRTSSRNQVEPDFCFFAPSYASKLSTKLLKVRDYRSLSLPRASLQEKGIAAQYLFFACLHPCDRKRSLDSGTQKKATLRIAFFSCGKWGIRTPGTPKGSTDFESAPFDHSGNFPLQKYNFFRLPPLIEWNFYAVLAKMFGDVPKARYPINPAQLVVWGRQCQHLSACWKHATS